VAISESDGNPTDIINFTTGEDMITQSPNYDLYSKKVVRESELS